MDEGYLCCACCDREIRSASRRSLGVCGLCDGFMRGTLQGLAPKLLFEDLEVIEQGCQRAIVMARVMTLALVGQRKEVDRGSRSVAKTKSGA